MATRRLKKNAQYIKQLQAQVFHHKTVAEHYKTEFFEAKRQFHNFQVRIGIDVLTGKPPTVFQGGSNTIELAKEY